MHLNTIYFGFKQKSFIFFAILFIFFTVGSNLHLNIYLYETGVGYFDLLLLFYGFILLIRNRFRSSFQITDTIFVLFSLIVIMMMLSELLALIFQLKYSLDSSLIKKIYFLYVYLIIYNLSLTSFDGYSALAGALVGTVLGGVFYFIENYTYTLAVQSLPEISGIQLLNDQNVIGQVLALSILSLFILYVLSKKSIWGVLFILAIIPILMTYSKAAMLQWLILLMLFVFLSVFSKNKISIKGFFTAILLGGVLYTIIYFIGVENIGIYFTNKLTQTESGSLNLRISYFFDTLFASTNSPIFGHGGKNFGYIGNILSGDWSQAKNSNSHNAFSELAFSSGYVVLVAFLLIIYVSASRLRFVVRHFTSRNDSLFVLIAFYCVIGLWASVQLQIYHQPWFYAYCGLVSGISKKISFERVVN